MAETLTSAIEFLKLIRKEKEVYVKFIKKDGTERIMKGVE
jgi:glutamate synthase domain-containing protein 2